MTTRRYLLKPILGLVVPETHRTLGVIDREALFIHNDGKHLSQFLRQARFSSGDIAAPIIDGQRSAHAEGDPIGPPAAEVEHVEGEEEDEREDDGDGEDEGLVQLQLGQAGDGRGGARAPAAAATAAVGLRRRHLPPPTRLSLGERTRSPAPPPPPNPAPKNDFPNGRVAPRTATGTPLKKEKRERENLERKGKNGGARMDEMC